MDVEAPCDDVFEPSWSAAFIRNESFDLATDAWFAHPFLGIFFCRVILIPCQIVEFLPAFVHGLNGLSGASFFRKSTDCTMLLSV